MVISRTTDKKVEINLKVVKQIKIIFILSLFIIISGCAGASKKENETLKQELSELKTTVGDLNWKLEELGNKFMLLQEQRTADREYLGEDYEDENYTSSKKSKNPPTNLKVVTLKKKFKKTKKSPKQEIYIKKEPQGPGGLYRQGQNLFLSGQYRSARSKFARLVEEYPGSDLADNALYWGAESYYSEELYKEALEIFIKIVTEYGDENKAPDAMLKVAYSYIELGSKDKARSSLEKLLEKYPDTSAALKAKKRLKSL